MSHVVETVMLTAFILATSVWVGGYLAIAVVARAATLTLDPAARMSFFRALGRKYFWVGFPALVIALACGAVLARDVAGGGLFFAMSVVSGVLLVCFALAVVQARRMTRLRHQLIRLGPHPVLQARVADGARAATMLRGLLGLLTLSLVVLGAVLAVG